MGEISRPQLAVYVAAAIAIALVGARYLREQGGGTSGSPAAAPAAGVRVERADDGKLAVVDVAGAVRKPGVYRLPASARVDDAVREAGGPSSGADLAGLNLAAKVEDGRQYIVPEKAPSAPGGGDVAAAAGGTAPAGEAAAPPTPSTPLNLNTATAEQLDQLDGVGPETARKIVAYRQEKGGFGSVEELDQVPGIGPQRLAALRDLVRV
jgi:competence protein ComEA